MRKNYEKAAFKSKPTSIRYNLAQFEIAKQLGGFGTVQQMFDVLLREYVRDVGGVVRSEVEKLVNWAEASKDNSPVETPPPPTPKSVKAETLPIYVEPFNIYAPVPIIDNGDKLWKKTEPPPSAPKPTKAAKPPAAPRNEPTPRGSYDRRKQKLGW